MDDPERLIGKRFVVDLRVIAVAPGAPPETRVVTVHLHGDRAEISWGELSAMIEAGFLVEVPERT